MHRFRLIEDGDSEKCWASPVMLDSDWPVYFLLRLRYNEDCGADVVEGLGKYTVEIWAVSPEAAAACVDNACRCLGMNREQFDGLAPVDRAKALAEYGVGAILYCRSGNNAARLLGDARKKYQPMRTLFGFYMDRPVNAIGASGWDAIRGDLTAPLRTETEKETR